MAVAAAELPCEQEERVIAYRPSAARVVPALPEDVFNRARADRLISKASKLAINSVISRTEMATEATPVYANLLTAGQAALRGDAVALRLVNASARTDSIERTVKAGHIMRVELEQDDQGKILQHGQYMDDVYVNSLLYASDSPQMRSRAEPEARNGSRIEEYNRRGDLDDNFFVVISRCADDMSRQEQTDAGFFVDTMTTVIQVTSRVNGKLITESAFVAGVTRPGEERHDEQTVVEMGRRLGVDFRNMSAAQILDTPLLILKHQLPHGAIDLVALYDESSGLNTFFGQAKPQQNYLTYREVCRQREADYEPRVQKIVCDFLAGVASLQAPDKATRLLHDTSQKHMLDQAIVDTTIDARVFGPAAVHIEQARHWLDRGDYDKLLDSREQAQRKAVSSSCPTAVKGFRAGGDNAPGTAQEITSESSGVKKMTCPFCGDKNQYGDPCSPNQHCTNCDARVVNGKVKSKGDGGHKARRAEAAKVPARNPEKQKLPHSNQVKAGQLALAA